MEIRSFHFDHLITFQGRDVKENWLEGVKLMEDFPLNHEVYKNGPVFFTFEADSANPGEGVFTYFLPINCEIAFERETSFQYVHQFHIEKSLLYRQAHQEVDFSTAYQKVKDYANERALAIEDTFICVLLEVYGEYMIDLYVPIKERSEVR